MEESMLKQQIEFMQFEIDDLKTRSLQQKNMYEVMLKSLEQPQCPDEEIAKIQEKCEDSVKAAQEKVAALGIFFESKIKELQNQVAEKEFQLKLTSEDFQVEVERLNRELREASGKNQELKNEISKCQEDLTEVRRDKERKISMLANEIDEVVFKSDEKNLLLQKEANQNLEELKKIYDGEKRLLQETIENLYRKIARLSKGNIKADIEEIAGQGEISQTVVALKSCTTLKQYISDTNFTPDEVRSALSGIISFYESKIQEKTFENISIESFDFNASYTQRQKSDETISKPPIHTPKSSQNRPTTLLPCENSPNISKENQISHEKSKQSEKMLAFAASMECEFCKYLFPTSKFYEHLLSCMSENESNNISSCDLRPSFQKVERMEKQITEMKLTLGKLKNQRDKARIAADRLLLSLKKTKLELAVAEENSGQKQMDLKNEIKQLMVFIMNLRGIVVLPQGCLLEIDKIINKSSRIFGGKIIFR